MFVALLGPLEVTDGNRAVPISGARLRRLLLRLAVEPGRAVSGAELVHAVWTDDPPADQVNALQTLVSRLRRALGQAGFVQQVGAGYRLDSIQTDVQLFQERTAQARRSAASQDLATAVEDYRQALALWRGPALVDVEDADWAQPLVARWQDERLAALRARIDSDLQLGHTSTAIGELEGLVRDHPTQEELTLTLMSALAAAGRPADGLVAYENLREVLTDELGIDPAPELRDSYQRLLQLTDADLTPARPNRRTNLRSSLTSFLGRDDEVKRLSTLLDHGRLATVVGPGGAGKTRLAGVAAAQWLDRLPDGVWLVELAPVTDEANIPMAVLTSLGILADQLLERGVEVGRKPTIDKLIDVLVDADCLLVMDNCEHLIAGAAAIVDQLLGTCRGVKVLATSREPLGIDGEALCMIPPLTLPEPDAGPGAAQSYPSVQLFADRAAAVSAGFTIDAETVGPVIEIVRRLDGLPLAIELAAARLRVLPVTEIAARLSDRFRLLTGGSRIAMPRHRTLRAVVEWSWDLLTDEERLLAERLAIFPSGASVDSAQSICADDRLPTADILELLIALVDKSLLKTSGELPVRYQMLETIREFGIERLGERAELAELRLRHARYFSALAQRHCQGLRGPGQLEHLRTLEVERDNILSALAFLCDAGDPHEPVDLAYALCWYWTMLGRHSEAIRWLRLTLDATEGYTGQRRLLVESMHELNLMATTFGSGTDKPESEIVARMKFLYRELGTIDPIDEPLMPLLRAILTFFGGMPDDSITALEPALASSDPWVRGAALMFRANMWENFGEPEKMRVDATDSLRLFTELQDRWGMASASTALAQLSMLDGDIQAAIDRFEQAADYLVEFGATSDASMMHLRLADLYVRIDQMDAAAEQIRLSQEGDFQIGSRAQRLMIDATLANIALVQDDTETAARLEAKLTHDVENLQLHTHMINGHVLALVLSTKVNLVVSRGELDGVTAWLDRAYQAGLATQDMPIMAHVGLAVARWAAAIGEPELAAEIHGATAQLRGAPDPTEPLGRTLTAQLIEQLTEDAYRAAFERGRTLGRDAALARVDPSTVR